MALKGPNGCYAIINTMSLMLVPLVFVNVIVVSEAVALILDIGDSGCSVTVVPANSHHPTSFPEPFTFTA